MILVCITARPIPGAQATHNTPVPPSQRTTEAANHFPFDLFSTSLTPTRTSTGNFTKSKKLSKTPEFWQSFSKFIDSTSAAFWAWVESLPVTRGQFIGIAVASIVLVVICICCICCRCCFRKKQKKRPLRDKLDFSKDLLFGPTYCERIQPHVDELDYDVERTQFDVKSEVKIPQIKFTILFDAEANAVEVTIHEGMHLPAAGIHGSSDAYVKVFLQPASKKTLRTNVIKNSLNPKFEETLVFRKITYKALAESELHLKVYDDDPGLDKLLGEVLVPIHDLKFENSSDRDDASTVTAWRVLLPEFKAERGKRVQTTGHICVALAYAPNKSLLIVYILRCKDLKAVGQDGFSDPYVTLSLIDGSSKTKKRKTTVKSRTTNPIYNENFVYIVDLNRINDVSLLLLVADYDKGGPGTPIGYCIIGALGTNTGQKHWESMRRSPGAPVAQWHSLKVVTAP